MFVFGCIDGGRYWFVVFVVVGWCVGCIDGCCVVVCEVVVDICWYVGCVCVVCVFCVDEVVVDECDVLGWYCCDWCVFVDGCFYVVELDW